MLGIHGKSYRCLSVRGEEARLCLLLLLSEEDLLTDVSSSSTVFNKWLFMEYLLYASNYLRVMVQCWVSQARQSCLFFFF